MNKKGMLLLFLIMVGFLIPKNVFAETTNLVFKTRINNWNTNSNLEYTCGSSALGVTPSVKVGSTLETATSVSCNFSLNDLVFTSGSDIYIFEQYDFSNVPTGSLTSTEYQYTTIAPGTVTLAGVDYTDDPIMFGEYSPIDSQDVVLYNMYHVDNEQNITGPLYVHDAYFQDELGEEKEVEKSLGIISISNFCVNFHFNVKGNIANTYGIFSIPAFDTGSFSIGGTNGSTQLVCDIDGVPLTRSQYDDFINLNPNEVIYTIDVRADEYSMGVTPDYDSETVDGDNRIIDLYVTATLNQDNPPTGLLYTIVPFVLLISLAIVGYLIIRNNGVKEDKEII